MSLNESTLTLAYLTPIMGYTLTDGAVGEKRFPHYALSRIRAAFPVPDALNRTASALEGAETLGMDDADVVAVLQALTRRDFNKSMTSHRDETVWQDVYKPWWEGTHLYVKITLDTQGDLLLISFKEI